MPDQPTDAPPPIQPPPNAPPPTMSAPPPGTPPNRTWDMLCHLAALGGFVFPFGNILGPLIIWLIKKDEFPSVDAHGKRSLNFQITVTIAATLGFIAAFILSFFCVGYLLFPVVFLIGLAGIIFAIIAAIKANNGEPYEYPFSFGFLK